MRIALLGTRGVPARYGGFETAVEEVGRRLADRGHRVVVYCRTATATTPAAGELPRAWSSCTSPPPASAPWRRSATRRCPSAHLLAHRTDAAFVFNAANAPLLPMLRAARIPVATHVDGLEWKRAKWGGAGRRYYRDGRGHGRPLVGRADRRRRRASPTTTGDEFERRRRC